MSGDALNKIYQNAALLSIADMAQKGSTGILALVIAHSYGPAVYGDYAAATSACGLFMMVTWLGFEQELTRRGGLDRSTLPRSLALSLAEVGITDAVALIALLGFLWAGVYSGQTTLLALLIGAALVVSRFQLVFRHVCLVLQESTTTALIQGVSTTLIVVTTLALVALGRSIVSVAAAQLIVAAIVTSLWLIWMRRRLTLPRMAITRRDLIGFLKGSLPFASTNLVWVAYFNFDTFLLSLYRPDSEVGVYAAVYRIIALNYVFGYAIANTFTPVLFERQRSKEQFEQAVAHLMRTMTAVAVPVAAGLFFLAAVMVPVVLGRDYGSGVLIARILSVAVFFRLLNFGLCEMLTAGGRQPTRIWMEGGMLGANVLFNCLLIPLYGAIGAAIATVGAELLLFAAGLAMWPKIRVPRPSAAQSADLLATLPAEEA